MNSIREIKDSLDLLGQFVLLSLCQSLCGLCNISLREDGEAIVLLTCYNPSRVITILIQSCQTGAGICQRQRVRNAVFLLSGTYILKQHS